MITQKQISLKIDMHNLEELDEYVLKVRWRNRNNIINRAIQVYLRLAEIKESVKGEDSQNRFGEGIDEVKKYLYANLV